MGITNDTYFEKDEYMSVSEFKRFQKCEASALSDWGEPSTAMLIGSYVDAYIEGTLEQFKEKNPNIFLKNGKGLKADYLLADKVCKYIDEDVRLQQFLSGDKQTIMTGEIAGVPFKIKMDSYSKGIAINDLKVMRTVTDKNGMYVDFITPWGYDIQLACYQEIVFQNTGERLPVFICAVTKEDPINSVIVNIPQEYLDRALGSVIADINRFYDIKMGKSEAKGCGVCKTCISTRKVTPIITLVDLINGSAESEV